jgi:hypothetical protein
VEACQAPQADRLRPVDRRAPGYSTCLSTYMSGKVVPSAALIVRMRRVASRASVITWNFCLVITRTEAAFRVQASLRFDGAAGVW